MPPRAAHADLLAVQEALARLPEEQARGGPRWC